MLRLEDHTHLAFGIRPKINPHPYQVVQRRMGTLIEQNRCQSTKRVYNQSDFDASMWKRPRDQVQRPLPCEPY